MLNILDALASDNSRNAKIAILEANKNNTLLRDFFKLSLDPMITFGIKKIPEFVNSGVNSNDLPVAFSAIGKLANRELTGNAAIDFLSGMLSNMDASDAEVLIRVIQKDPRCGVAIATANAVWGKDFILDFPVMKATAFDEKSIKNIKFPAYSQLKVDGARVQMVITPGGKMTIYSSNGREMDFHGLFDARMISAFGTGVVIDGEMVMLDEFGKIMERKKSNGIVNRAVHGTLPFELAKRAHFIAFDLVEYGEWIRQKSDIPYKIRLESLIDLYPKDWNMFSIVETKNVSSVEEAKKHFRKLYENGEEGTILKNHHGVWENKRSKDQVKFKGVLSADLRCVAVELGTPGSKYEGKIGALVCETQDGKLQVNVGSGLSDEERSLPHSAFLDRVIEVEYNEVIKSKVEGAKYSLFLPRFLSVRTDKDNADTIDLVV